MFGSVRKRGTGGSPRPGKGGGGGFSFIAHDMVVSGGVSSKGQLHVDGRIDGDVRCDSLIEGEGGTIAGNIQADNAHLAGLVDGAVKARVVTLDATARITGDVTYETISMMAGAAIEGRLTRKEGAPAAGPPVEAAPPVESAPAPAPAPALAPAPPRERKRARLLRADEPSLLPALDSPAAAAAR